MRFEVIRILCLQNDKMDNFNISLWLNKSHETPIPHAPF